jgi:hypothetical protein
MFINQVYRVDIHRLCFETYVTVGYCLLGNMLVAGFSVLQGVVGRLKRLHVLVVLLLILMMPRIPNAKNVKYLL